MCAKSTGKEVHQWLIIIVDVKVAIPGISAPIAQTGRQAITKNPILNLLLGNCAINAKPNAVRVTVSSLGIRLGC